MSAERREWNVVATIAVLITLVYVGVAAAAMLLGKIEFAAFRDTVLPIVTAWGGYLAHMLGSGSVASSP